MQVRNHPRISAHAIVSIALAMVVVGCSDSSAPETSWTTETPYAAMQQGYLEKAALEPGAHRYPSGLIMRVLRPGDGESPKKSDTVKVHYHGTLILGSVFDSSVDRNEPATFPLTAVIPCWTEALTYMKVGEKSFITCPPEIAYGDAGSPPLIKGGAVLNFEIELLDIVH